MKVITMSLLFVHRRSRMIDLPNSRMFLVCVMRRRAVCVAGDDLLVSSFCLRVFAASSLTRSRLDCSRVLMFSSLDSCFCITFCKWLRTVILLLMSVNMVWQVFSREVCWEQRGQGHTPTEVQGRRKHTSSPAYKSCVFLCCCSLIKTWS